MAKKFNGEKLKAFLLRRRINTMGLFMTTGVCALLTLLCAVTGFARTGMLIFVTAMLVVLCLFQMWRLRSSFRTMRSFKGFRKRKKRKPENP